MSDDDYCGDTGGGGSFDTGGGNDSGACMDPAECTEITFTENADYDGGYYGDGGGTFHQVHSSHHAYITDPKERIVMFIIVFVVILLLCKLNIIIFVLKFLYVNVYC